MLFSYGWDIYKVSALCSLVSSEEWAPLHAAFWLGSLLASISSDQLLVFINVVGSSDTIRLR